MVEKSKLRSSCVPFVALVGLVATLTFGSIGTANAQASGTHRQVGVQIVGEDPSGYLGESVDISADGTRMIIGVPQLLGFTGLAGKAEVYKLTNGDWTQLGTDIVGETEEDHFGSSVAMSADGSRVIVGAPNSKSGGTIEVGYARVFDWTGASWTQVGGSIDGDGDFDRAGSSVAMSTDGTRITVGYAGSFASGYRAGYIRMFELIDDEWSQLGADIQGAAFDWFGASVDMSADGNRVIAGAANSDGNGRTEGYAATYEWVDDSWVELGEVAGEQEQDGSGNYVSMSADGMRIAAGGYEQARVFEWLDGEWVQFGQTFGRGGLTHITPGETTLSEDGSRVSIGNRVFHWTGHTWTQIGPAVYYGPHSYPGYGLTFAISNDGSRIVVGEPSKDTAESRSGVVSVFDIAAPATCAGRTVTADMANQEIPTENDDVIKGTPGPDIIDALGGNDVICALQGDDEITGGDGNDSIYAAKGNDTMHGGAGNDLLIGGPGADFIHGDRGNDRIQGGHDDDTMFGDGGSDIMRGGNGNDSLVGGSHPDLMWGNLGADTLVGGGGDDVLRGGAWSDVMNGGSGSNDGCTLTDPGGLVETRIGCEAGVFGR